MSRPLRPPEVVLVDLGACGIVLGGLVAAVTGPLELEQGSWAAAYLVLVVGVAQVVVGLAPAFFAARPTTPLLGWTTVACWNVGSALVIGGTLARLPLVVDGGSLLLMLGVAMALYAARRGLQHCASEPGRRLARWAYRGLLLLLLVSIPVGMVIGHLRASP